MPIDPRDITPVQEGPQITEDRKCSACDYSLQGLHIGMRCPECGQPIRQVGGEARESLTDAPIGYLKGARFGFGLLFWSLLAISAYIVAFGGSASLVTMAIAGGVTVVWWLGVYITTEPRPRPGESMELRRARHSRLRLANRVLQSFWFVWVCVSALAEHGMVTGSGAQSLVRAIAWMCSLVAGIGLIGLILQLMDFAHWTSNTGLVERLRLSAWGLGISTPLVLLWPGFYAITQNAAGGTNAMVSVMLVPVLFMAFFAFLGVFLLCLYQLWDSSRWAVQNWAEARAKEQRQRDKAERIARRPVVPIPENPEPLSRQIAPGPMADPAPFEASPNSDDVKPYDLAPDTDSS